MRLRALWVALTLMTVMVTVTATPPRPPPKRPAAQQFPPLRLVNTEQVSYYDQVEGVYHFATVDRNGAPKYVRHNGVGSGAENVKRFLFAQTATPGRWVIADREGDDAPTLTYVDVPNNPLLPPGFEQTADEEGWLGRDGSPLWQRWDGSNWVPYKIYFKPARLVTCGSAIKLHSLNPHATTAKLNGWAGTTLPLSGFECVAGLRDWSQQMGSETAASLWQVTTALNATEWGSVGYDLCRGNGMPLRHNAIVRLRHVPTGKWLHSGWHQGHQFKSVISQTHQEISLAGAGDGADYDSGDNWFVQLASDNDQWTADSEVTLKHLNTACYLALNHQHTFQRGNGGNGRLLGNAEVACVKKQSDATSWRAGEGVYVGQDTFLY